MLAWILLATTALVALAVGLVAWRRPILWRMAVRNALRRPKQTLTVVAGLMVGTAIISSALVASDSARGAIRGYVYQSLGEVDESVAVPGYPYFPQAAADHLVASLRDKASIEAASLHAIWQGAALRGDLYEPHVALIGYDGEADASFGVFETAHGPLDGRGMRPGDAIATAHVAKALELKPGHRVQVTIVPPMDPLLPRITTFAGNATPVAIESHAVKVDAGATRLFAALAPLPGPAPSLPLRLVVVAPDGSRTTTDYSPAGTQAPLLVNVTAAADGTLQAGTWTLYVEALGIQAYRLLVAVAYPVYNAEELRERAEALRGIGDAKVPGLELFAAPKTMEFTIRAISTGGRADLFDFRDALFIRLDDAQTFFGRDGQVNLVKFSNPGDARSGVEGSAQAVADLEAALAETKGRFTQNTAVQHLRVNALKEEFLAQADAKGQTLTGLLVFAGSLSIITGLLLILNIFTMLAEERRSELGMARAVGLTRGDLVRLSVFEGSLYAVAAAALGAALGLLLAFGMIEVMNAIVSSLRRDLSFPPIEFTPTWQAVSLAFSLGALLAFTTIAVASRRQAGINVVRAIRRLDEPEVAGSRLVAWLLGLPLGLAGALATFLAWTPLPVFGDYRLSAQVLAPLALVVGLGLLLRPWTQRHRLVPTLAAVAAAYWASTFFLVTEFENRSEANVIGPIRGVLMTLSVVILVVHYESGLRAVGNALARLRGLRAVAIPAFSYPLHRKFRTGMTLAMFSVVLLSIGFFSIFGALFQVDPARQTGGFDIEARSTLLVEDIEQHDQRLPELAGAVRLRVELPEHATEDRSFITVEGQQTGTFRDYRHLVYGYDAAFAKAQAFRLMERLPEYATDQAAYEGVLAREDQVIVSYVYSTSPQGHALSHHVGETLQLRFGSTTRSFTIAGIQEQYHYPGIFLPRPLVEELFPSTPRLHLFQLNPGFDAVEVAKDLERNYRGVGLDAKSSVDEVLEQQSSFRQVLGAMKLFLGLGLVVGVLSLGIVTSRSVLERRQEIGMMRALGYTGRQVRRVFFVEVTATILLGALVGIACALVVTYGLWFAVIRPLNYPYVVPWGEIGLLVLASYLVALAATWAPIGRTAKVSPAEALRYVE
jgi:putative ABC transport system permease protein